MSNKAKIEFARYTHANFQAEPTVENFISLALAGDDITDDEMREIRETSVPVDHPRALVDMDARVLHQARYAELRARKNRRGDA